MPDEAAELVLSEDEQGVLRVVEEIINDGRDPTLERVTTSIFGPPVAGSSEVMLMPGEVEPTRADQHAYCREQLTALDAKGCIEAPVGANTFPEDAPFTLTPLGREWLDAH